MKTQSSTATKLILSLWDTCPTQLHRAGLGGLWSILDSLSAIKEKIVSWDLSPDKDEITLIWECSDYEAITWLLSQAYQLTEEGIIKIPGNEKLTTLEQIAIHNGLTSVFYLQPRAIKSPGKTTITLDIDDKQIEVEYKPLEYYPHQDLRTLKPYKKEKFKPHIPIVSWLYPGGGNLHEALGAKTKLEETPEGLIALAFAPIACSYYRLRSRLKQAKSLWALIIPDVENLEDFANYRQEQNHIRYLDYFASGISDASLKYLTALAGAKTIKDNAVRTSHGAENPSATVSSSSCQVWVFGAVPWSKQTPITAKQTVSIDPEIAKYYELCRQKLPNGIKVGKNGTFIDVSFGREIAAENLIRGKPWYADLHRILALSTDYVKALSWERLQLLNMKESTIAINLMKPNATLFSDVFTWIVRSLYGQVGSSTQEGNTPNFDRVRTNLQMSIRSVKTQQQFVRWWTKLTSNPVCTFNPFLQDVDLGEFHQWVRDNWEECLSLAALAIIAYKDPWKVERTKEILLNKGLKMPKKYDEYVDLPVDTDSDITEDFEEEELETNDEVAMI
ncbi:MAG: type I-MYXAN CRISPR-associated Cas8a1/Cmx1 [Xenococcaceae cyanobacterium MO_188.B32]|nr:type I-MYXAN CRISPR-associated Cas8a1/Cmx1 [Xenococcaceae cyanobacterium MO_188.B32]